MLPLVLVLGVLGAAARPSAAPSPRVETPTPTAAPTAAPEYRIGAGDVLDITVFDNTDLSRSAAVKTNGTVALPLLGEVGVSGLTVAEAQAKLTSLLGKDYLVNPQVEVKVKEYQSQFVTVLGEVNTPGRKPLRGQTRLVDILVESGGFRSQASGEIVITRVDGTFADGGKTLSLKLGSGTPTLQDQVNLEIPLRNGDLISASPKYYVTVEGEVVRPGRYTIEANLTVTGALSLAGGLTRFGSQDIKIRRIDASGTKILDVDLKDVRKGKKPDVLLLPGDVVSIGRRLF